MNRAASLLLHHDCPLSNVTAADNVTTLHLHKVATAELAVDRKVEPRPISQAAALIEVESYVLA